MFDKKRSGWAGVGLTLAVLVLLSVSGCVQGQKRGIESRLMKAQSVREEVMSHPRADSVQTELDQSIRYQEKAESYMAKSRSSTSVELQGAADSYATWAEQMAELSLKKAQEAQAGLEQGPEPAAPQETASASGEEKDSPGPPGPLSAAEDESQDRTAPPVEETTVAQGPMTAEAQGRTAQGEIIDPAREELQGPRGPLKEDSAPEEELPAPSAATAPDENTAPQGGEIKAPEPVSPPDTEPAAEPRELYRRALNLYRNGQYSASRRLFLAFLAQHPGHKLAVNSQYWIGETYYAEAEYVLALGAFEAVVNQYPDGSKVPDGMVKMGLSELKLGRLRQARQALEECLAKYPSSAAARVARSHLEKLEE